MTVIHRLVHAFLEDRLNLPFKAHLGSLVTAPNFLDDAENHLRCSALVGFKGKFAIDTLGLTHAPAPPEGLVWRSSFAWSEERLTRERLRTVHNVYCEPIWDKAQAFLRGDSNFHPKTREFFEQASVRPWQPPVPPTGWRVFQGQYICIEGNARLHALSLDVLQHDWDDARHAIEMFVGRHKG